MSTDSQTLLKLIINGVSDPIDLAKQVETLGWNQIQLGRAIYNLLRNGWIAANTNGDFIANT